MGQYKALGKVKTQHQFQAVNSWLGVLVSYGRKVKKGGMRGIVFDVHMIVPDKHMTPCVRSCTLCIYDCTQCAHDCACCVVCI